jgi:hypothetical protein
MLRAVIIAGLIAFSGPAFAQDPTPVQTAPVENAAPAATEEASRDDEVVCRDRHVTGTRISVQRVCRTRAQWRAEAEAARQLTEDMNRRNLSQCIPLPSGTCG